MGGMSKAVPRLWVEPIAQYGNALRAGGAPASTIKVRSSHVRRMARGMGGESSPSSVTAAELVQWAGAQDWERETRRCFRSSAVSFFRWAVESGHCASSPAERLPSVKQTEPRKRPAPEIVYREALARSSPREALMLRLAAEVGMRRAEVAQAHTDDLVDDLVGWSIVVHGKGDKDRIIPLPDELAGELRRAPAGYLFPGAIDGHLSPDWVGKLVARLLPGAHTMHALRRKFATAAYAVDKDVFVVQELLGHASPVTTRRYVEVPRDDLRRTVNAVAGLSA